MKWLAWEEQNFLRKRATRLNLRRLAWKKWKKLKRRKTSARKVHVAQDGIVTRVWAESALPMPSTLCLDRNFAETLTLIEKIRENILANAVKGPPTTRQARRLGNYVDFKPLRYISLPAALVLAAYYDRAKSITGKKLSTIDEHKWNRGVLGALEAIGFNDLLELKPKRASSGAAAGSLRILRFLSGVQAEGQHPGVLQEALAEMLPDDEAERLLYIEPYSGMFEAILNSYSWAYPQDFEWDYPPLRRWWIGGAVDLDDHSVVLTVFDQGVTIPAMLPRWKRYGRVERLAQRLARMSGLGEWAQTKADDGLAIFLAMRVAESSTNLPQHGKGLHTMLEVAQRAKQGRLRVLSRHGEYCWETGKKPFYLNHAVALSGTLVEWRLQL